MTETPLLTIIVNGETVSFSLEDFPGSVGALITVLAFPEEHVVAEVNGELVKRSDIASRSLTPGDKVELVRFVGGG
ncbi:MAG: sulfur carrier protein ThiS [Planctomycetota bacterium]|jgi:thiamine biosynthesis protein ThiS|nr:sulfur carrier protein ThiS [Planctomycetota bacterium]